MTRRAGSSAPAPVPRATIRPSATATSAVRPGAPLPSTTNAPVIFRSSTAAPSLRSMSADRGRRLRSPPGGPPRALVAELRLPPAAARARVVAAGGAQDPHDLIGVAPRAAQPRHDPHRSVDVGEEGLVALAE